MIKSEREFFNYFYSLDQKKKQELLVDIFSENEKILSKLVLAGSGVSASEIALVYLRKLSSQDIRDLQELIETIVTESIGSKNQEVILNKIRVLALFKQAGLRAPFLEALIFNKEISESLRIHFAKLLVYLYPKTPRVNWDLKETPFLIAAKVNYKVEDPIGMLSELLEISTKPNKLIIESLVGRPLTNLLINLFITKGLFREYVSEILPKLEKHWLYEYIQQTLELGYFSESEILSKIESQRLNNDLAKNAVNDILTSIIEHEENFNQRFFYLDSFENYATFTYFYERHTKLTLGILQDWNIIVSKSGTGLIFQPKSTMDGGVDEKISQLEDTSSTIENKRELLKEIIAD